MGMVACCGLVLWLVLLACLFYLYLLCHILTKNIKKQSKICELRWRCASDWGGGVLNYQPVFTL